MFLAAEPPTFMSQCVALTKQLFVLAHRASPVMDQSQIQSSKSAGYNGMLCLTAPSQQPENYCLWCQASIACMSVLLAGSFLGLLGRS